MVCRAQPGPVTACFASLLLSSKQQLSRLLWDGEEHHCSRPSHWYLTHSLSVPLPNAPSFFLSHFPLHDLLEKCIGNEPDLCYILLLIFFCPLVLLQDLV